MLLAAISSTGRNGIKSPSSLGQSQIKGLPNRVLAFERAMGMAESQEVMNVRQASEYLGVSPDTLYKYVSEDTIPAFKLGNRWKFKKALLDRWMERKSSGGEGTLKKQPRAIRAIAVR